MGLFHDSIHSWKYKQISQVTNNQTGGKDRTDVLATLILRLAGASYQAIVDDYALTRIGVEPAREMMGAMLKLHGGDGATPERAGWLAL